LNKLYPDKLDKPDKLFILTKKLNYCSIFDVDFYLQISIFGAKFKSISGRIEEVKSYLEDSLLSFL